MEKTLDIDPDELIQRLQKILLRILGYTFTQESSPIDILGLCFLAIKTVENDDRKS